MLNSIFEKIKKSINDKIIEIIKQNKVNVEMMGIFFAINTERLLPEPSKEMMDTIDATPIKNASLPKFSGSKLLATKNQKIIPIKFPPISPIPIKNKFEF